VLKALEDGQKWPITYLNFDVTHKIPQIQNFPIFFIMKITANENDFNDILQTFWKLLLSSSVDCKLNCSDLAASHAPPPSPRIQLSHVIMYASRHYVTTETALGDYIFRSAFLLTDHENLHQDHCSSICNALMMITGVVKTFPICRWYRFHWPWFGLFVYQSLQFSFNQNY